MYSRGRLPNYVVPRRTFGEILNARIRLRSFVGSSQEGMSILRPIHQVIHLLRTVDIKTYAGMDKGISFLAGLDQPVRSCFADSPRKFHTWYMSSWGQLLNLFKRVHMLRKAFEMFRSVPPMTLWFVHSRSTCVGGTCRTRRRILIRNASMRPCCAQTSSTVVYIVADDGAENLKVPSFRTSSFGP